MRVSRWGLVVAAVAVAGCSGRGDRTAQPADSAGMGMGAMPMQGMQMMAQMRAHLDSVMGMSPRQMGAMMAAHQAVMSQMMDRIGADMRGMKMSATPEWTALTDSVRQDLAELPNLEGQALSSRMRAHAERVRRLMAMHERMMGE